MLHCISLSYLILIMDSGICGPILLGKSSQLSNLSLPLRYFLFLNTYILAILVFLGNDVSRYRRIRITVLVSHVGLT